MASIVCTIAEKDFYFGVGALINSLLKNEFKGNIYVGFRGELKGWCKNSTECNLDGWEGVKVIDAYSGVRIFFLPILIDTHLAHYKPFFVQSIWEKFSDGYEDISYFDPDIIVKCKWSFFKKWMSHGVAIVHEIIMRDMPMSHPIKKEWQGIVSEMGYNVLHKNYSYFNCGFFGVSKNRVSFIKLWSEVIEFAVKKYKQDLNKFANYDRTEAFWSIDQDSFNIALLATKEDLSEMGPEGMDFENGGQIMSHAVGPNKPWRKKYVYEFVKGFPPTIQDKLYWNNVASPLNVQSLSVIKIKCIVIKLFSLLGRFYKR